MIHHFENKTVAIVGNSKAIMSELHGEEIDSHDIVIRFNDAWPNETTKKFTGIRTSFMSCAVRSKDMQKRAVASGVKLIWPSLSTKHMIPQMRSRCFMLDNANRRSTGIKLGAKDTPSSGLLVLNWVLVKATPSKIDVYGFDSFKNADWHTGIGARINGPHNHSAEEALLNKLDDAGKIRLVRYKKLKYIKRIPVIKKKISNEVVILCCGPTVVDFVNGNKQFIDDRITIGGNSISELYVPDCYVCCDHHAWGLYGKRLHRLSPYKCIGFDIRNYLSGRDIKKFDLRPNVYWLEYQKKDAIGYDPNIIYHGRTVGIICINIALRMKPKKIYVAGMDGYTTGPDRHNYFNGRERPPHKKSPNETVSQCLKHIKRYTNRHNIELCTVTKSIHEGVLPRITF